MSATDTQSNAQQRLQTFVRNRYFYGKLLDAENFELEQNYFNGKRWLINRLVCGYGVVCGLDVLCSGDGKGVYVTPGVALDRAGREIIVPQNTNPIQLPPKTPAPAPNQPSECCDGEWVTVCICYQQCESDPVPVLTDCCGEATACSPSSIRERFKVVIRSGKAPAIDLEPSVQDFVMNGKLNYYALVDRVTKGCPDIPKDTCIPLANVKLPDPNAKCEEVDITIRPIVYTNDLLFDLLVSTVGDPQQRSRGGKY